MNSLKDKFENSRLYGFLGVFGKSILAFLKGCYPIFVYFAIMLLVILVLNAIFGNGTIPTPALEAIGGLAAVPYLRYVYRKDVLFRAYGIRTKQSVDAKTKRIRYFYAMVTIVMISFALNNLFGVVSLDRFSPKYASAADALYSGPIWLQILCLGFIVPYAEELLYRGVIMGRLKDAFGSKKAIIISAILFGLAHWNLAQFLFAIVVGLALAYFADKNQSIIPAYLGHVASNLIAIAARYKVIPLPNNILLHIVLAIVFGAIASAMFGLQFKIKVLK